MAFPTNWPPRSQSNNRSIRAFKTGSTSTDYADNAYIFMDLPGANTYTTTTKIAPGDTTTVVNVGSTPGGSDITQICANTIIVTNDGSTEILVSFDGVNTHAVVKQNEVKVWRDRREAGIAVKTASSSSAFRIEAY